jgi:hypothetical protein
MNLLSSPATAGATPRVHALFLPSLHPLHFPPLPPSYPRRIIATVQFFLSITQFHPSNGFQTSAGSFAIFPRGVLPQMRRESIVASHSLRPADTVHRCRRQPCIILWHQRAPMVPPPPPHFIFTRASKPLYPPLPPLPSLPNNRPRVHPPPPPQPAGAYGESIPAPAASACQTTPSFRHLSFHCSAAACASPPSLHRLRTRDMCHTHA